MKPASTRPLRLLACALSAAALAGALAAAGWVASEHGSVTRLASCGTLGFDCAHGRVRIAAPVPTPSSPAARPPTGGAQVPTDTATGGSTRVVAATPAPPAAPSAATVVGDVTTARPGGAQAAQPAAPPVPATVKPTASPHPPTVQPAPASAPGRPTTAPIVMVAVATVTRGAGTVTGVVATALPRALRDLPSLLSGASRVEDHELPVGSDPPSVGGLPSVAVAPVSPTPAPALVPEPDGHGHASGPAVPTFARPGPASPSGRPQGPFTEHANVAGPPEGAAAGPHPDPDRESRGRR